MNLHCLKKKLAVLMSAATFGASMIFSAPQVEALSLNDAINIGGAIIVGNEQKRQLNKQIDLINNTEEGRQALFSKFKEEYGVNTDAAMNERLSRIMSILSNAVAEVDPTISDKPYLYFVSNQETLNAACSLGHIMMVNAGTMIQVKTDDQIAAIIGHEMGHGQKDHVAKGARRQINEQMLAQIGVSAAGGTTLAALAGTIALNHSLAHGDRKQETEADNLAWDYILHTNYNIGAPAAVMQKFVELEARTGKRSDILNFFQPSDHPDSKKRLENYVKKLYEYSGKHATVDKKGVVTVNGKNFLTAAATDTLSAGERNYFVLGNLAAAYHNGYEKSDAYVKDGTVYLGAQPIITPVNGDESAEVLAKRLNEIK